LFARYLARATRVIVAIYKNEEATPKMSQFGGPVFEMAQQQFHVIADHLEIPDDERNRLILPKRAPDMGPTTK
jgi:hypothetical protein